MHRSESWEPTLPASWAAHLGLVEVPMFGAHRASDQLSNHTVLLDGLASSFALTVDKERMWTSDDQPLSWAWSSDLRYWLVVDTNERSITLRRWDTNEVRRFMLPTLGQARDILSYLQAAQSPQSPDVILHLLRVFRDLRHSLALTDAIEAIRAFHLLVMAVPAARRQAGTAHVKRFEDIFRLLSDNGVDPGYGLEGSTRTKEIGFLLDRLVEPHPASGRVLDIELLFRHAAGRLYQEAHIQFERDPQLTLFGPVARPAQGVSGRRDVRFTPTNLARFLVQETLRNVDLDKDRITILDPACGSGVFLLEALKELEARSFAGRVELQGIDLSPVACEMAERCLSEAKRRGGLSRSLSCRISAKDALTADWGVPDIVLMNPPFISWETMAVDEREHVRTTLGSMMGQRPDTAMAFIWKAAQALAGEGVLGTVLPSPLLETVSGTRWRANLRDSGDFSIIGRFRGYRFFKWSFVEPSFLVWRRLSQVVTPSSSPAILIADDGAEDEAIRGFRVSRHGEMEHYKAPSWEWYKTSTDYLLSDNWLPHSSRVYRTMDVLRNKGLPSVKDLFKIHQGIRTGWNPAFLVTPAGFKALPEREQRWFKPVAGQRAIRAGRLSKQAYLFWPYDDSMAPAISEERELSSLLPIFFERNLLPHKGRLENRKEARQWWLLTRPRGTWQLMPKLVTTYFGGKGSFAFDAAGDFVVLQGHAWLWASPNADTTQGEVVSQEDFVATELPWAYLCLLNSEAFGDILGVFCPRVQGGQFDLSNRFVGRAFLPDLRDIPSDLLREAGKVGRQMAAGTLLSTDESLAESLAKRIIGS